MIFYSYTCRKVPVAGGMGIFMLLLALAGCAGSRRDAGVSDAGPTQPPPPPFYADMRNWAAHPALHDLSDSVPAPYRPLHTDTSVDVFFLYPTSYLDPAQVNEARLDEATERYRWNARVDDPVLNATTDKTSMLNQASVFNAWRVFSPRYRQAHIRTFYLPDSVAKPFFDTAYADVLAAFRYYLQHENRGRPFVIASHSQGTLHAARLLKEEVEGKEVQKQLVAAYLTGLPVRDDFFTQIPPCDRPDATGCFVSWRTFKKGYVPDYVERENFRAVVVNPLSWTLQPGWVSRKANRGAVLYRFNKPKPYNVGAGIQGNILWSSKPRFFGNLFFTRKNYHIGDINLFWMNIRENVEVRVKMFRKN